MVSNGQSSGNGASVCLGDQDRFVRTLPWVWRVRVPGMAGVTRRFPGSHRA